MPENCLVRGHLVVSVGHEHRVNAIERQKRIILFTLDHFNILKAFLGQPLFQFCKCTFVDVHGEHLPRRPKSTREGNRVEAVAASDVGGSLARFKLEGFDHATLHLSRGVIF